MDILPACSACGRPHDAFTPCPYGSAVKPSARLTHLQVTVDEAENRAIDIFRRQRRRFRER